MSLKCPGCSECQQPSLTELVGLAAATHALADVELERVCPRFEGAQLGDQQQTPDFRSTRYSVEVKEFRSAAVDQYSKALRPRAFHPSGRLQMAWNVWPDHQWTNSPSVDSVIPPNQLIRKLIPFIAKLEAAGHTTSKPRDPTEASFVVNSLLGGGSCTVLPASFAARYGPGILLGHLVGGVRSGYVDDALVNPVQSWIDNDPLSLKMAKSLDRDHPRTRCGVLVLGGDPMQPAPAQLRRSLSDFPDETPQRDLRLRDGVGVFIVATEEQALVYKPREGWSRTAIPTCSSS